MSNQSALFGWSELQSLKFESTAHADSVLRIDSNFLHTSLIDLDRSIMPFAL